MQTFSIKTMKKEKAIETEMFREFQVRSQQENKSTNLSTPDKR